MIINLIYDTSVNAAPAAFKTAIGSAAQYLDNLIANNITVNFTIGWGENNGVALGTTIANGGVSGGNGYSYSAVVNALTSNAPSVDDQTAIHNLPTGDPTNGGQFYVGGAQEKAWGLIPANGSEIDGTLGFSSTLAWDFDPSNGITSGQTDLQGVALHELTHALGREAGLQYAPGWYMPLDLFRYAAPATLQLVDHQPAYFSIDGGKTNLNNFDTIADSADWASTVKYDSFGYGYTGVVLPVTATDIREMDILGFNVNGVSVSAQTIQADYLAIVRIALPLDQATTIAQTINAGTQTETQYVTGLLSQVANTTIPAVAVEATMYGATGTSAENTALTINFLPAQVANAAHNGLNPQVYACEALGLVFAFGNENGSTTFSGSFGPSNSAMPNSTAGDAAFATAASNMIFGSASTANLVNVMKGFVGNWKAFYAANGVPGITNPTAAQIDLAARGASWGDMVGVALANSLGPLNGETINFLEDAAQGIAVYGASLTSQLNHGSFHSGAAATIASSDANPVNLTGVASYFDNGLI